MSCVSTPEPATASSGAGASCSTQPSTQQNEEANDINEIEEVVVGCIRTSEGAPLVPNSRISPKFQEHLKMIKENPYPGVFDKEKWFIVNGRWKPPPFPTIKSDDILATWTETIRLGEKYKKEKGELRELMPYYYFLLRKILQAKLECLANINVAELGKYVEKNQKVVKNAKDMIQFQERVMEEMVERYIEANYIHNNSKNREKAKN